MSKITLITCPKCKSDKIELSESFSDGEHLRNDNHCREMRRSLFDDPNIAIEIYCHCLECNNDFKFIGYYEDEENKCIRWRVV